MGGKELAHGGLNRDGGKADLRAGGVFQAHVFDVDSAAADIGEQPRKFAGLIRHVTHDLLVGALRAAVFARDSCDTGVTRFDGGSEGGDGSWRVQLRLAFNQCLDHRPEGVVDAP